MGKLKFEARTLDEDIVRDGLCALAALDNSSVSRQMAFLVGGIATQSYLPSSCRRPTSDMDLAVRRSLTYSEFRNFAKEAATWKEVHGLKTDTTYTEPGIKYRIRAWQYGLFQLVNPGAVCLIIIIIINS